MKTLMTFLMAAALIMTQTAWARAPELGVDVVKVKHKSGWTEVTMAIQNMGTRDLKFKCCQVFLENADGYSIQSLTPHEVRTQLHNRAKTAAVLGSIVGAGLGLGGAISGKKSLGYAALGVFGASAIAGTAGGAVADSQSRSLIIDNIMRNQVFPAGLKVAGVVYFPPRKKWPGSRKAQAVHLSYKRGSQQYRSSAPAN